MARYLFLVVALASVTSAQIAPTVVITKLPVPPNQAGGGIQTISWQAPKATSPIYCVSDVSSKRLGVECTNCNASRNELPWLNKYQDISQQTGFPTLMWDGVEVTKEMSGKIVMCHAEYETSDGTKKTVTTQATIEVLYMERPRITDENDNPASFNNDIGFHFFVECNKVVSNTGTGAQQVMTSRCSATGASKQLKCYVDANPPATDIVWLHNGAHSGEGMSKQVTTSNIDESLTCRANNRVVPEKTSDSVVIKPWTKPNVYGTNFEPKRKTLQDGRRIKLGATIRLECGLQGDPKPTAKWFFRDQQSIIRNASCTPREFDPQPRDQSTGLYKLASACEMTMQNYSFGGDYWCSACSSVAQNTLYCSPGANQPPTDQKNVMLLDVYGPPKSTQEHWTTTSNGRDVVHSLFCSDPQLTSKNQIAWIIDGQPLYVDQTRDRYTHLSPQQNGSNTECRVARLAISSPTSDDYAKAFTLRLTNQFGNDNVNVPMKGTGSDTDRTASLWWLWVLLALLALLIFLCCICCICCRRRVLTSWESRPKKQAPPPPEKNFAPNLAPQNYSSEPSAIRAPHLAVTNGYQQMPPPPEVNRNLTTPNNNQPHLDYLGGSSYPPSDAGGRSHNSSSLGGGPVYVDYGKKSHEGYNYAELDLVTNPSAAPPVYQPTEYAHLQVTNPGVANSATGSYSNLNYSGSPYPPPSRNVINSQV